MKKIMILGAGASQVPLYRAARRLGLWTVAASIPGDYPGFPEADEVCYADITKPEEILAAARRTGVSGITTCGMDTGIRALGYACDALGLRGITYRAACALSDKYVSKGVFCRAGVPNAAYRRVENEEELAAALRALRFPVAIKAVDLMGSRGIYRCDDAAQARAAFAEVMKLTKKSYCLAEEFLTGLLFGCEGLLTDGKLDFLLPYGTEIYRGGAVDTSLGHWAPFEKTAYQAEIEDLVLAALREAGAVNTPFNCDLMLADGKVHLIEINGRAGASCLSETVGIYYGLDYYETLVRHACGEDVSGDFKKEEPRRASVSRILTAPADGILKNVRLPKEADDYEISVLAQPGERVSRYRSGRDRLGQLIVRGESVPACKERMEELLHELCFQIEES